MLRRLVLPNGRLRRTHYVATLLLIISGTATALEQVNAFQADQRLLLQLCILALFYWLMFCTSAQRAHDQGMGSLTAAVATALSLLATLGLGFALYSGFEPNGLPLLSAYTGFFALLSSGSITLKIAFGEPSRAGNQYGVDPR